jgi:hypothetical protein
MGTQISEKPERYTLLTGFALGESPRWHGDRLWFSDWGAGEVVAVDLSGRATDRASARRSSTCACSWLALTRANGNRGFGGASARQREWEEHLLSAASVLVAVVELLPGGERGATHAPVSQG